MLVRLRTTCYVIAQHLLHHGDDTTSSASSQGKETTDKNPFYGFRCFNNLAIIYCGLANVSFYTFRFAVSSLAVRNNWLSLLSHVRYVFISDALQYDEVKYARGIYCGYSVHLCV